MKFVCFLTTYIILSSFFYKFFNRLIGEKISKSTLFIKLSVFALAFITYLLGINIIHKIKIIPIAQYIILGGLFALFISVILQLIPNKKRKFT